MPCECTTACGDDPKVQARTVLGCAEFRARSNPALTAATNTQLRNMVTGLVDLMNRLEPDVADAVREQAEAEWDTRKAQAVQLLADTE